MATVQIVPKYSFPYVEMHIEDNTIVNDSVALTEEDNYIKSAYAVVSDSGIDGRWFRKNTLASAKYTLGEVNFKKHGQPLLQAYDVLDKQNAAVWFIRCMPDNAAYANARLSTWFKADSEDDYANASERKFRIKFTTESFEDMYDKDTLLSHINDLNGAYGINEKGEKVYIDGEGYRQIPTLLAYDAGRGKYGNNRSFRISQNINYEKEFGIKLYTFEVMKNDAGLNLEAQYVGGNVSSNKYDDSKPTLIDDVIDSYYDGDYPIVFKTAEENIEIIYDAYVEFLTQLHEDLVIEYEDKVVSYGLPEEVMEGIVSPTADQEEMLNDLNHVEALVDASDPENIPDIDEFDLYLGKGMGTSEAVPFIVYPAYLSTDIDITADDYDENDYTETEIVNLTSVKGVVLSNGSDGYFDNPRVIDNGDGTTTQWTYEQEVEECYNNAFSGVYDPRILSTRRVGINIFWDAGYPLSVKATMAELAIARDDAPIQLDAGIITSLSGTALKTLKANFERFDDRIESVDIHNYKRRDPNTMKKITVTISNFLAPAYMDHVALNGIHVPFVRDNCILTGHIKDSLAPIIDEWNVDTKEWLNNNRFNYFECKSENVFYRATQNTRQKVESDLLEENNIRVLYLLKRCIEDDANSQLYNFADSTVRDSFVAIEKARYSSWEGTKLQTFDISFKTSEYEFRHSILHLYIDVVFRGLTKRVVAEIRINKRTYNASSEASGESETYDYIPFYS